MLSFKILILLCSKCKEERILEQQKNMLSPVFLKGKEGDSAHLDAATPDYSIIELWTADPEQRRSTTSRFLTLSYTLKWAETEEGKWFFTFPCSSLPHLTFILHGSKYENRI